jgi:hypothetical protein
MGRFEIKGPTRRCAKTGRPLQPGDIFYGVLVETPNGLERLDFAPEAWEGPPPGAIGYWRGRVPESQTRPQRLRPFIDDATAWEAFRRLEGAEDSMSRVVRYVLALHLMRRRFVKLLRIERRDGDDFIRLRSVKDKNAEWVIWCPPIDEEQLRELEGQLEELVRTISRPVGQPTKGS